MKKVMGILLFIGMFLLPINSLAKTNVEIAMELQNVINNCLNRTINHPDGKTSICMPAFGKDKEEAYKNMFRYQSLLGYVLSNKKIWVTTESGFTFQKKEKAKKFYVTYIDTEWDGCGDFDGYTYCEFRLIQEEAKDNKLAEMMSYIGVGK